MLAVPVYGVIEREQKKDYFMVLKGKRELKKRKKDKNQHYSRQE
jgi:hypothetical protein